MSLEKSKNKTREKKNDLFEGTLHDLASIFKNAAAGNFSGRVDRAPENEIVSRLFKDVNTSLALMEEKMSGLQRCNIDLEHTLHDLQRQQKEIEREKVLEDAIISYLGEGMVVVDLDGSIIVMNERARDMFGLMPKEAIHGYHYSIPIVVTDAKGHRISKLKHPIEHVLRTGEKAKISLSDDIFCKTRSGTLLPVMVTASPIKVNNVIRGVATIFHDVTKEKRIDEIKSDFIAIASHQLRTPLTVMNLHTEMLLAGHGGELTPEQREYLSEIAFYNKKMAQLLNDFLVVSKIELGTFTIESKPVDVRILLDDVLQELRVPIIHKKLKLKKSYGERFPLLHTDPTLVRIVLQNVIGNAVKYTSREGSLHIALEKEDDAVHIVITDSGIGIPPEEHGRIFTKLYRGSNARKRDSDGSGLGLYIAKAVMERCGGKIWFVSPIIPTHGTRGGGTTFTIALPLTTKK